SSSAAPPRAAWTSSLASFWAPTALKTSARVSFAVFPPDACVPCVPLSPMLPKLPSRTANHFLSPAPGLRTTARRWSAASGLRTRGAIATRAQRSSPRLSQAVGREPPPHSVLPDGQRSRCHPRCQVLQSASKVPYQRPVPILGAAFPPRSLRR